MVILETRLKDGLRFLMRALKFRAVGSFGHRSTFSEVTEIGFGLLSPIFGLPRQHLWWRTHLSMQETKETWIWPLGYEDPLEKGMATHSSILAQRIPWTEEAGGLQSIGLQRVRHDWSNLVCMHIHTHTHTQVLNFLSSGCLSMLIDVVSTHLEY